MSADESIQIDSPLRGTDLAAAVPSLIPFLGAPSAFAYRRNHLPHFVGEDT